ncbi:hypothetical protein [Chroococcidiopsis sp.]|uniref:hypothetical protein n=1 Tax=Chroococcidiopsis sp. TaxID=3088168 RepID=UPI003F32BEA3
MSSVIEQLDDLLVSLAGRSMEDLSESEQEIYLGWQRNEHNFTQAQYDERDKWWVVCPSSKLDDLEACNNNSPDNGITTIADNDGDLLINGDCVADCQAGRTFQFHKDFLYGLNFKRAAYPLDFPPPPQM